MEEKSENTSIFEMKVGTLNVHSWSDGNFNNNPERIVKLLDEAKLDVVALQEAIHPEYCSFEKYQTFKNREATLARVARLSGMNFAFAPAFGSFGNAILSRYEIINQTKHHLHGKFGERRVILCTVLKTSVGPIGVHSIHLDHIHEDNRMKQIEEALSFLKSSGMSNIPHILCGDFNSLGRSSDYPPNRWKEIVEMRAKNNWEIPKHFLYDFLERSGYIDAWKQAGGKPDIPSCWAKTRIDYIWSSPSFFQAVACKRFVTTATDHHLMTVTFRKILENK